MEKRGGCSAGTAYGAVGGKLCLGPERGCCRAQSGHGSAALHGHRCTFQNLRSPSSSCKQQRPPCHDGCMPRFRSLVPVIIPKCILCVQGVARWVARNQQALAPAPLQGQLDAVNEALPAEAAPGGDYCYKCSSILVGEAV